MLVDVYQLCYPENNGVYDQRGILRCPVSVAWEPFLPHPHRKLTVRCRLAQPFYVHEWVAGVSWGRTTCNCSGRRRYHKAQVRGRMDRRSLPIVNRGFVQSHPYTHSSLVGDIQPVRLILMRGCGRSGVREFCNEHVEVELKGIVAIQSPCNSKRPRSHGMLFQGWENIRRPHNLQPNVCNWASFTMVLQTQCCGSTCLGDVFHCREGRHGARAQIISMFGYAFQLTRRHF
jgi:hypothetical protein